MANITLKKINSATWDGNGFGASTADWVVAGFEHIAVRKLAGIWFALDMSVAGRSMGGKKIIAKGVTKSDLLKTLETRLHNHEYPKCLFA